MKYIIVLGDGMSDYPVPELGGKTPLQAAKKPGMDFIASHGETGLVHTIPDNVSTGSDTANMSVMGFNPEIYYTGRAPVEAVSMGIPLEEGDIAYRCNLVNLSGAVKYEDKVMVDYSSDEISSKEAAILINAVNEALLRDTGGELRLYPGISYRHCMVWRGGGAEPSCTPPHDILTRRIGGNLPIDTDGSGDAPVLNDIMKRSYDFLSKHEVNLEREKRGLLPANSLWLWGQGKRLKLDSFSEKYGITGAVIAAVDCIKGIGMSAGLRVIEVEGATGTLDTNYRGKSEAAAAALDGGCDFVYLHVVFQ
jgi:2,3-bisphosphoglycerate-independent phosphoglycerate mutase